MKNYLSLLLAICYMLLAKLPVLAIYDPLSVPNNKVGIHILAPDEIGRAADLINTSGGDWGYVTVPIQPTDRDTEKWQRFMNTARERHLIPIIRITTIPKGGTWSTGQDTDLVDFANFLNELVWPIKNRYIILFNEVNRATEWGGQVNPAKYTQIVKNARIIFQERNSGFFLLGPALDNALPESDTSMTAPNYLKAMEATDPAIWSYFDGWASHSYPNPNFSALPTKTGWLSIVSYRTETSTLKLAPKPIFITETGWAQSVLTPSKLESYWRQAWTTWNNDSSVAAVTPFVLAGGNQFRDFSMYSESGALTTAGHVIHDLKKVPGRPHLVSGEPTPHPNPDNTDHISYNNSAEFTGNTIILKIENFFRKLLGMTTKGYLVIGDTQLSIEIADNAKLYEQGLSNRDSLQIGEGMLFIFPRAHMPMFWMKDMNFAIDMIWIKNDVVIDITSDVPIPNGPDLPTYSPNDLVNMVLETPAGYAKKTGIQIGDSVSLHN